MEVGLYGGPAERDAEHQQEPVEPGGRLYGQVGGAGAHPFRNSKRPLGTSRCDLEVWMPGLSGLIGLNRS